MRFSVTIFFKEIEKKKEVEIPTTYRRGITSLLKEALKRENPNYFELYYGDKSKNKQKPFTFSTSFSVKKQEKKSFILNKDSITLYFSSNEFPFFISIYNGLLKLKDYKLFGYNLTMRYFHLLKENEIKDNMVVFKTFSPILVRDIENKKGKGYLAYNKENSKQFIEQLQYTIKNLVKNFLLKEITITDINISIVKMKGFRNPLYGDEISNDGILSIEAPIEILKLIYDLGLGAKRSQGFGMLELVL